MPASAHPVSPHHILHSVFGTGDAFAGARQVAIEIAIDPELPDQIACDLPVLIQLGRALLAWCLATPGLCSVTLALWRGGVADRDPGKISLEATGFGAVAPSPLPPIVTMLAERIGGQAPLVLKRPGAMAARVEWPLDPAPTATPTGERYRQLFHDRRLLLVGQVTFELARDLAALAALGIDPVQAATRSDALAHADAALAQRPFDFALISTLAEGVYPAVDTLRTLQRLRGPKPMVALLFGPIGARPLPDDLIVVAGPPNELPPRSVIDRLAQAVTSGAPVPQSGPPNSPIPDLRGARILIAEDVATNQTMMRAMLEPTGAHIDIAVDGAQAVARHLAQPYDLVLMDIQMPRMDGLEATRAIRAKGAAVPIIALTAHAKPADRARYLAAGLDGYLAKPLRMAELYATVARYCARRPRGD